MITHLAGHAEVWKIIILSFYLGVKLGLPHADSIEFFIHDTNKCTFYIYTNTILYRAYMFRHHEILMQLYTKI